MSWVSGAGYTITHAALNGGTAVTDSAAINLGDYSTYRGDKVVMDGVQPIVGGRNKVQEISVRVSGTMAAVCATSGTTAAVLTITNPAGSTATANAKLVNVTEPNYEPEVNGVEKTVVFKLTDKNAVLAGI